MSRDKKITHVSQKDIQDIIANSIQNEKNRLSGSAAEQKKAFVSPIANLDDKASAVGLIRRLGVEADAALDEIDESVERLGEETDTKFDEINKTVRASVDEVNQAVEKINKTNDNVNAALDDIEELKQDVEEHITTQDIDIAEIGDSVKLVEQLAKGRQAALSFNTYADFVKEFNALPKDEYSKGQNIYIATLNVPDLWVFAVSDDFAPYTYSSDEDIVDGLRVNGKIRVGYYEIAALETGKVALGELVGFDDIMSPTKPGVAKCLNADFGLHMDGEDKDTLAISQATIDEIKAQSNIFKPITPKNLSPAVKEGVVNNTETLTDEEKASACEWLGALKNVAIGRELDNVLAWSKAKGWHTAIVDAGNGLALLASGALVVSVASDTQITTRAKKPLSTNKIDLAVTEVLTNYKGTAWTDEQKAKAGKLIGVDISKYNLGAYDECVSVGDGSVAITRKTGIYYVNPNATISYVSENVDFPYFVLFDEGDGHGSFQHFKSGIVQCNTLPSAWILTETDRTIYVLSEANNNCIVIRIPEIVSVAGLRQWLSEQPTYIQGQLKEQYWYTERVLENRPIASQGLAENNWIRNEWMKGLNLFNIDEHLTAVATKGTDEYTFSNSGSATKPFAVIPVKAGMTYTLSMRGQHVRDADDALFLAVMNGQNTGYINADGTYNTDQVVGNVLAGLTEKMGETRHLTFTARSNYISLCSINVTISHVMLTEGRTLHPCEPYHGGIVREKYIAELKKEVGIERDFNHIYRIVLEGINPTPNNDNIKEFSFAINLTVVTKEVLTTAPTIQQIENLIIGDSNSTALLNISGEVMASLQGNYSGQTIRPVKSINISTETGYVDIGVLPSGYDDVLLNGVRATIGQTQVKEFHQIKAI